MSTLAIYHSTIVVSKFNSEVIIYFTVIFTGTVGSTSCPLNRNRILSFYPIGNIDIMHVLLDNMIATKPVEIKPISHLVFHFRLFWFARANPNAPTIPINLSGNDIANGTILYALNGFSIIRLITSL